MTVLERFSAGFEVRENIELIKRGPGNYFIALAIYLVTGLIAQVCLLPLRAAVLPGHLLGGRRGLLGHG